MSEQSAVSNSEDMDRRTRILEAALDLFAERGYEGTSVAMVARAADVAKPLVAYHFGSKQALWEAAVDLVYKRVGNHMKALAVERAKLDLHGNQWLRHFLRSIMLAIRAEPAYARLTYQEGGHDSPRLEYLVRKYMRPNAEMRQQLNDVLIERGVLAEGPAFSHETILLGLVERPMAFAPAMQHNYGVSTLTDEAIEAHLDVVMHLLVRRTGR